MNGWITDLSTCERDVTYLVVVVHHGEGGPSYGSFRRCLGWQARQLRGDRTYIALPLPPIPEA